MPNLRIPFRLLLLLFTSSVVAEEASPRELVPLVVGTRWEYAKTTTDPAGGVERSVARAQVVESRLIAGKTWFRYREFGDDFWIRNAAGGQYELVDVDENGRPDPDSEVLFYRFPVEKPPVSYKAIDAKLTVVAVDRVVTTPAGRFTCYVYRLVEPELVIEMSLAPGVGLVKNRFEPKEGAIEVYELTKFTPVRKKGTETEQ